MTIIELFITFVNSILEIKILGFSILNYLITFTILIIVFRIIYEIAGVKRKDKEDKGDKKKK